MLLGLMQISGETEGNSVFFSKVIVFLCLLILFVLLSSGAFANGFFDLMRFLVLFLPLQYVSLVVISLIVLLRCYHDEGSTRWFLILALGYAALLITCLLYYYDFLVGSPFSPGSGIFLQLTGVFLLLSGVSGLPDAYNHMFLGKYSGITYFRDVVYKTPVGLN
jgi:hypothetical protein